MLEYEIRNAESADYFALITQARIDEISLTDNPANRNALVRSRYRIAPVAPFLKTLREQADLSTKAVQLIQRKLECLRQLANSPAPVPRAATPATTRPQTEFKRLVEAMNQQAEMQP